MNYDEIIIVCIRIADAKSYHKDSVERICHECDQPVWVMPHNYKEKLICTKCAAEIAKDKNNEIDFGIREIDVRKAIEHLEDNKS